MINVVVEVSFPLHFQWKIPNEFLMFLRQWGKKNRQKNYQKTNEMYEEEM